MNLASLSLYHQALLVAAALVLFTSFMMLATARIRTLIYAFAWQGALLAIVTALVALVSDHPHLYISALLTLGLKALLIPWMLYRLSKKLYILDEVEPIRHPSMMLVGGARLFFAAVVAPYGMPMIVELGIAFDVLVAMVLFGVFFFQIRASIDTLDVDRMNRLSEKNE